MRAGSHLMLMGRVTLIGTAFGGAFYSWSCLVMRTLQLSPCIAIGLNVRFLLLASREPGKQLSVIDAKERNKIRLDSKRDGIILRDDPRLPRRRIPQH